MLGAQYIRRSHGARCGRDSRGARRIAITRCEVRGCVVRGARPPPGERRRFWVRSKYDCSPVVAPSARCVRSTSRFVLGSGSVFTLERVRPSGSRSPSTMRGRYRQKSSRNRDASRCPNPSEILAGADRAAATDIVAEIANLLLPVYPGRKCKHCEFQFVRELPSNRGL